MNDQDIAKLVSKLTKSLVSKKDIDVIQNDIKIVREDLRRLDRKIDGVEIRLGDKIDELNIKADTIMKFANEVDKITLDHEKRLKRTESITAITH